MALGCVPRARRTCIRAHNATQASGIQVWISCSYECVLTDGPRAACELLSKTVIQQVLLHVHGTVRATPAGSVMHGFQIKANALVSCNNILQDLQRVVSNGEPVVIHLRMYKQDSERGVEADTGGSRFAPDSVLGWGSVMLIGVDLVWCMGFSESSARSMGEGLCQRGR